MPSYTFIDQNGDEVVESMKFSEIEPFLIEHPHLKRGIDSPSVINHNLISTRSVKTKPDDGFRDVLRNIKKAHRGSTINTF